jgi:hypothetical protein
MELRGAFSTLNLFPPTFQIVIWIQVSSFENIGSLGEAGMGRDSITISTTGR